MLPTIVVLKVAGTILLKEAQPTVFAALGYGVLDAVMVGTGADY